MLRVVIARGLDCFCPELGRAGTRGFQAGECGSRILEEEESSPPVSYPIRMAIRRSIDRLAESNSGSEMSTLAEILQRASNSSAPRSEPQPFTPLLQLKHTDDRPHLVVPSEAELGDGINCASIVRRTSFALAGR